MNIGVYCCHKFLITCVCLVVYLWFYGHILLKSVSPTQHHSSHHFHTGILKTEENYHSTYHDQSPVDKWRWISFGWLLLWLVPAGAVRLAVLPRRWSTLQTGSQRKTGVFCLCQFSRVSPHLLFVWILMCHAVLCAWLMLYCLMDILLVCRCTS